MNTELAYMLDSYLFSSTAKVAGQIDHEDGRQIILLDRTIFYPQGGGQRFDVGQISNEKNTFEVEEVRFVDGVVWHIGKYIQGKFINDEDVKLSVDQERRMLHSKLQSAGHLIDMAVRNLGYTHLVPSKGAHYPEWSEVDYEGMIEGEAEKVQAQIQDELKRMIQTGYEVKVEMSSAEEAKTKCYVLPAQLPQNKPIRIVAVWNDLYMPCGGTHVKNISELANLQITRVKCKKGITKINYSVS